MKHQMQKRRPRPERGQQENGGDKFPMLSRAMSSLGQTPAEMIEGAMKDSDECFIAIKKGNREVETGFRNTEKGKEFFFLSRE
jgi:hypothetical protein